MFPVKGTTVWVNFKDKPYLGKVLQTSPELDMVCVRISNYLDHVSRDIDKTDLVAHSCPVSNPSLFSNRQSSVVITCGLADICRVEPKNDPHFEKNRHESTNDSNSEIVIESNPVHIPKTSENRDSKDGQSSRNNSQISNSPEDDADWSDSFAIKRLLKNSESDNNKPFTFNNKYWVCWHCHLYLSDEHEMNLHVINKHKLEALVDKDNWIVLGGIKGLDYDEVKSQEDSNIKDLDNIHISSISRKRQFLESTSGLSNSLTNSNEFYSQSYCNSTKSFATQNDFETSFNDSKKEGKELFQIFNATYPDIEFEIEYSKEIGSFKLLDLRIKIKVNTPTYEFYKQPAHKFRCHEFSRANVAKKVNNIEHFEGILSSSFNNRVLNNEFSTLTNEKIQLFHNILLRHHVSSSFSNSLTKPSNFDQWPHRLRSNSDQLISSLNQISNGIQNETEMLTPTKRSRVETGTKKCRKMYGIDQRHLWCNQCKWKKACSRFSSEIN